MTLKQAIKDFLKEEDGLTTVEYAVAGGIIAVGVLAAFQDLRDQIISKITEVADVLRPPETPK